MMMNPNIILQGAQDFPDLGAAFRQGQAQNALRTFGADAMAGNQNALRELAQYDPELAFDLMQGRQQMDLRAAADARAERESKHGMGIDDARLELAETESKHGMGIDDARLELAREQGRQQAAEHAARMSANDRAVALEEAQKWGAAATVAAQSPEQWEQFKTTFGDDMPDEFRSLSYDQAPLGIALVTGVTEGLGGMEPTAEMRNLEYRAAEAGLVKGTPAYEQFMAHGGIPREMRLTTTPDGGVTFSDGPAGTGGISDKPPAGFTKVQAEDGTYSLAPIEGGPATQMPAELAARIAVADDGLKVLPEIMKRAEGGDLTGVLDWAWGAAGRGQQGADRRDIKGASEAITRLLTGAGMNIAEIENEGWMYTPQITDDAATVVHKLKRLEDKLKAARAMALQGRGGAVSVDSETGTGVREVTPPNVTGDDIDSVLERYR